MRDDKKAIAAMIVSKAKKPEEEDMNPFPSADPEEGDEMGLDVAVDDMMAAFEAKDPGMLKASLKAFIEQCH